MRAIWKGYLKISLVTIPVKIFSAINKRKTIQFHLLHAECKGRLKQRLFCPICGREVKEEEIVKGYEYERDKYVIITEEDLEKVKKESKDTIEVIKFLDSKAIDPIYYANAYYLAPDGKIGAQAFSLFLKAMRERNVTALGKLVMRGKEHILSITPYDGTFVAYELHYPIEIQDVKNIEGIEGIEGILFDEKTFSMVMILLDSMMGVFEPKELRDEYEEELQNIIMAKVKGEEISIPQKEEKARVISLMEALEKSIKEIKKVEEVPVRPMAVAGRKTKEAVKKKAKDAR